MNDANFVHTPVRDTSSVSRHSTCPYSDTGRGVGWVPFVFPDHSVSCSPIRQTSAGCRQEPGSFRVFRPGM